MKKFYSWAILLNGLIAFAQAGAPASPYYNGFNFSQTGTALKTALATKITTTHTNLLTYGEIWNADKITDLDPTNSNNVLLIYGWENGTDADVTNDRSRNKNSNGGNSGEWNREHVYAKSLGVPQFDDDATNNSGVSDAGEDAHHLRASDVQRNNTRGNLRFADGDGNSKTVSGGWYPGDEWKGDVARMMMYMYLRYGNQCLPTGVGKVGLPTVTSDSNMISLFLEWNAEDPVSTYEDARNSYHGSTATYAQRNRNPFIDNPYLATLIWGGPLAENRWPSLSTEQFDLLASVAIYPNPSNNHRINIDSDIVLKEIQLININGQLVQKIQNPNSNGNTYTVENLPSGFYFLKISSENQTTTKKVIIN